MTDAERMQAVARGLDTDMRWLDDLMCECGERVNLKDGVLCSVNGRGQWEGMVWHWRCAPRERPEGLDR